jgi:chromate reductase, NAD(P)H dehydrogenase (quinone)
MATPASLPSIVDRKLAKALVALADSKFKCKFIRIDHLPMFNPDLETNLSAEVVRYKTDIVGADGVPVVMPEHDRWSPA